MATDVDPVRFIKDAIHDQIPISFWLSKFIDTRQFQRLRNIKQLGTSHYVWPGASHTRFEHSLGVAYLARLMVEHLRKSQPELHISNRDVDCVETAGLCHDLGHGPWSHVWDGTFMPAVLTDGRVWRHEDGSELMFDALVKENGISISTKDATFIKALVAGDPTRCSPDEKPFLFDIVANKRNGLDVDKFDYIQRDSHMIGNRITMSLARIINSARVLDNQICYNIKDANQIFEFYSTRFKSYKLIYDHKTSNSIESMLADALLSAEPFLRLKEHVFDEEKYINLTDTVVLALIETSTAPELAEARNIINRIHSRDIYKCVDYKVIDWPLRGIFEENITKEKIVEAAKQNPSEHSDALTVNDVDVQFSVLHYGMKEKNPMDSIKFYSKRNPNVGVKAEPGDYSNLMPKYFAEIVLRIFTKKPQYFGLVQAGYRALLADMERSLHPLPLASSSTVLTPPVTEAPGTPSSQVFSRQSSFGAAGNGSSVTPFSANSFMTISPTFVPISSSLKNKTKRKSSDNQLPSISLTSIKKKKMG